MVKLFSVDRQGLGARSDRQTLPAVANCHPGSHGQAFAGSDSQRLDPTFSAGEGRGRSAFRLPQGGRKMVPDCQCLTRLRTYLVMWLDKKLPLVKSNGSNARAAGNEM